MNEVRVCLQAGRRNSGPSPVKIAKLGEEVGGEGFITHEGQTLTQAALRTRVVHTQPLVVTPRTLRPAVTQVVRVDTDLGVQALIKSRTLGVFAVRLVLMALTVKVAIASRVHRHADGELTVTSKVGVGTSVG
jgi:hypothetical protein